MKSTIIFLPILTLIVLLSACRYTKKTEPTLNLNFETVENGFPTGWEVSNTSDYKIRLDSTEKINGKRSVVIESNENSSNQTSLSTALPENYEGKKISLSGYIKTRNIADGYGGLFIRIQQGGIVVSGTTVKISGTIDWKKYEITTELYPEITKQIIIGGYLLGKGKMWLDSLQIKIDGKNLKYAKPYKKKLFPAEKDKEFDNGSKIVFHTLNEQKINNLELLGRIWGFLKYHHPSVATGNYNWDYELFRFLPTYLKANNTQQRDQTLLNWITKYGRISKCKNCQSTPDSAFLKPDLSWIDKSVMNPELNVLLHRIYLNRNQGNHYYIYTKTPVANPMFLHENAYTPMPYPDAGFQLLALYRYWNMIQYFYPSKYLTDKDWSQVLKEYIPKFISAKTKLDYELTTLHLINELDDSHAQLLEGRQKIDSLRGYWMAPFQIRFIENQLVVTKFYTPASQEIIGLKVGDIITHINGKTVKAIVDSIKGYYPASNEAARMRDMANDMLRSNQSIVHVNYLSSNKLKQNDVYLMDRRSVYQYMYPKDTTKCYKFIGKDIGYVTLKSINATDIDNIKKDFKNTKGIIIDIRNYPSYFVPFLLGSYFVSSTTPFVKFTKGNSDNPGEFMFASPLEIPAKPQETYRGKLVVIVNEYTQSQAEYTAMAFRAGNNTIVIGSQTAGADGDVSEIYLPGGIKTWISGIGVYYPDGRQTQRVGIVPDIVVKPTIKGIREGRDELLEKAIEIIERGK